MFEPKIGRGEKPAVEIIQWLCPGWIVLQQVEVRKIIEWRRRKSDFKIDARYQKIPLDILMVQDKKRPIDFKTVKMIAVQIQDNHHTGPVTARVDKNLANILEEDFDVPVIEIHERDAVELFKNRINVKSAWEVCYPFVIRGVIP